MDGGVFFFQAEDGIRDKLVTGVQTCALPISPTSASDRSRMRSPSVDMGTSSQACPRSRNHPWTRSACQSASALLRVRSEEHTSELQSLAYLVCRLLLEKKKTSTCRAQTA